MLLSWDRTDPLVIRSQKKVGSNFARAGYFAVFGLVGFKRSKSAMAVGFVG